RAYYGTMTRGLMMSTSGVPTNAVYGFSTMLNKALELFKPTHILIAFDTGDKTFRHEMFENYKGTRKPVDEALVSQFALIREFLDAANIHRLELSGYEADDIIGTLSKKFATDEVDVLTSDRDLLQIIDSHTDVLLMKKGLTNIDRMDKQALMSETQLTPEQIIDMKALMGDASDNIPGVPSIGEKTALKLLLQYGSLDKVYENVDEIKGKMGENLRTYKDQAYLSYDLAKINTEVPLEIDIEDFPLNIDIQTTNAFYRKYDMLSLVVDVEDETAPLELKISEFDTTWIGNDVAIYLDITKKNGLESVYLSDGFRSAMMTPQEMILNQDFLRLLKESRVLVSESKPLYRVLLDLKENVSQYRFDDLMLLSFIIDGNQTTFDKVKDAFNLWDEGFVIAKKLFDIWDAQIARAETEGVLDVYYKIEAPLTKVLAKSEALGFNVDQSILNEIEIDTKEQMETLTEAIYAYVDAPFNLNSPKQLSGVLFDELKLPTGKKRSTAVDVLEGLKDQHPMIPLVLEYRKIQKLYSTYAVGLQKHITSEGKIHTTFNQHATQTGRLSSSDPNLQNISIRDEMGRKVRSAFVASDGHYLLSVDYSQIELRVLSFLANETKMIEAFNEDHDIHEETARDIFGVEKVNSNQRREAKSVNFGIIYGMSDYGLSQQLNISIQDAHAYITRYHEVYPNISKYMDAQVEKCLKEGYVETYFKRRRYIHEIHDNNRAVKEFGKRAAMNAPIQGTAADIIKLAMVAVDAYLEDKQTKLLLQVHDELVFDVPEAELETVQKDIVDIMENIVSDWPIKLEVSCTVGKNWMES
ncbi:MAG TPA: DNA polymerase I, partial [Erysipelothrix sp.]|nr:DNA polymerase I [Erysipelothrix sp.]